VISKGRTGEVYNIGGHNEWTNIDIVKTIIKTMQDIMTQQPQYLKCLHSGKADSINDSLITYVKDRPGHDKRYAIDPTKIENELGWKEVTNFKTGIVQTVHWYLDNQQWVNQIVSGDYVTYYKQMYEGR